MVTRPTAAQKKALAAITPGAGETSNSRRTARQDKAVQTRIKFKVVLINTIESTRVTRKGCLFTSLNSPGCILADSKDTTNLFRRRR